MHIKQVIISGFRSFRSQNEIEPFSSKHNVIVGRNGSGKSNFFDAIQFVLLGPRFSVLRQEDRQHLLHEGAGSSVMAAYVEIVFDNSDGRLSVDSDEVVLRRTVGHKKDEFFLNRKRVQKSEVSSLLESAGFSKSNPYYIVQQGKVANLCVMKDRDRLNLLKEVAGTTVYEERRAESVKIMQETASKKERVEEVLKFIEERLGELEQEKQELTEYEQLDKQRRALEYCVYDREYAKANEQLQQMEILRESERERQHGLHSELHEVQDEISSADDTLNNLRQALDRLAVRRAAKAAEVTDASSRRSALEVELQEAETAARDNLSESNQIVLQLEEVAAQVEECKSALALVEPEFLERSTALTELKNSLAHVHARVEALYGRQGRGKQFASKKERDTFLQQQIDSIGSQLAEKTLQLQQLTEEVSSEEQRLAADVVRIEVLTTKNAARVARFDELTRLIQECTQRRNDLQEARKNAWKENEKLQEKIEETKQDLEKGKQQLNRSIPQHISKGLEMVEKIVQEKGLRGYHGPVIDNISLRSEGFKEAVEVAAGNALFHVIVDTDETASFLIKELERQRAGRLTFLPLSRLRSPNVTYPESADVRPLMEVALDYDQRIEPAIKHVFGQKLLARDLDVAAHFSKEFRLDAITKDGDQVNRKGGFEGGYHDERVSRINAVMNIREANATMEQLLAKAAQLKSASEQVETKVNSAVQELQRLDAERTHLRQEGNQIGAELSALSKQVSAGTRGLAERKSGLTAMQSAVERAEEQQEAYRREQRSPLKEDLSAAERNELRQLEEQKRALQQEADGLEIQLMSTTNAKDRLVADLENNLQKRHDELQQRLAESSKAADGGRDFDTELSNLRLELAHTVALLHDAEKELAEMDRVIHGKNSEIGAVEKELEAHRTAEHELQDKVAEAIKMLDKLLNKRSMLLDTVQSRQRLIRDLGSLPRRELEQFQSLSEKALMSNLKGVNEQLKKYSSVNRKALDQFVSFNEQREMLMERKTEMDRDSEAIQELIDSLDAQKDEAILRTFRGVSKHFTEVFEELVPGGSGQLIMRTTLDNAMAAVTAGAGASAVTAAGAGTGAGAGASGSGKEVAAAGEDDGADANTEELEDHILEDEDGDGEHAAGDASRTVSTFQGVQARVSFSGSGQQYQMQQLSGGQKALVALALIFAIQRCDPAPFYLFDEIDQALDANYRDGVARLIQRQVNSETAPAQFITTTFRPELVAVANQCYGIALQRKVSNIYPLEKADAQNFVTNLMLEEEAVGQISKVPDYAGGASVAAGGSPSRATAAGAGAGGARAARGRATRTAAAAVDTKGAGDSESDEDEDDNEAEEELYEAGEESKISPHKIRRVAAGPLPSPPPPAGRYAGKASRAGAAGAAGGRRSNLSGRGGAKRDADAEDEEDDDDDDNDDDVDEGKGGYIELDGEEEQAFANLGLNDAEEDDEE